MQRHYEQEEFVKRLLSLKMTGESDEEFARRAGINREYIYRWRKNEYGITLGTIRLLANRLGINPAWLAFGVGSRYNNRKI